MHRAANLATIERCGRAEIIKADGVERHRRLEWINKLVGLVSDYYFSSEPRNAMLPSQLQVMPMQLNIPSNVP